MSDESIGIPTTVSWEIDGKWRTYRVMGQAWDCVEPHTETENEVGPGCSMCRYFVMVERPEPKRVLSRRARPKVDATPLLIEVHFRGTETQGELIRPTHPVYDRVWRKFVRASLAVLRDLGEDVGDTVGEA